MSDHYIVDIGFARIAKYPENFDVIVTSNLYGDIISDITAEICGSVGLAGSANIGDEYALFEAIHGSAPDIAGKQIANPSGLLNGAIMMLVHLGKNDLAEMIANAWLKTLEDGVHTADIYKESISKQKAGTMEFAKAVVNRFNQKPMNYPPIVLKNEKMQTQQSDKIPSVVINNNAVKELVGVDVFIAYEASKYLELKDILEKMQNSGLKLQVLSVKGQAIWPGAAPLTMPVDDCIRARFTNAQKNISITHGQIAQLLGEFADKNIDFVKTEHLYNFDGKAGFSLAQGE
jgi:isocitrate dehydrogenase